MKFKLFNKLNKKAEGGLLIGILIGILITVCLFLINKYVYTIIKLPLC